MLYLVKYGRYKVMLVFELVKRSRSIVVGLMILKGLDDRTTLASIVRSLNSTDPSISYIRA